MKPEVQTTFLEAFPIALEVDGTFGDFGFSDGNSADGRIPRRILYLDVTLDWTDPAGKDTNYIFHELAKVLMLRANDVPECASLYSNAFLDLDGITYRIDRSSLDYGLWTLWLRLLGTD